ncbi:GNAT family N-acetyltransferase [Shewanella sp. Isolate7]|uniref:GNAT family N-acetyltransferase n=1 Tax=Shewanella sp. Isolate7 TaxID=2908528 RepID=UPI001EFD22E1|nr:GNAT family N-acetyltransferase [Shewanella sp. Isolate7]MCG9722194.1 GNAT family N-acetyltransferase [Shewanella sp. Isolate7]
MYTTSIEHHTQLSDELIDTLIGLSQQVPEFDGRHQAADYQSRLSGKPFLVQLIRIEGELAGYKIGYAEANGEFYSWLGAILPEFRQLGLAKEMMQDQERWAKAQGFNTLAVKTYNRFASMLQLLIKQGYKIAGLENSTANIDDNKLVLNKLLS